MIYEQKEIRFNEFVKLAKESLKRDIDVEKINWDNNLELVYCHGSLKAVQVITDDEFNLQFSFSLNVVRTVLIL